MSEENKTSNDNEQPAGREGQNQPAILINTQYIKDLSLEIPHAPEIFKEIKSAPEVQINVEVSYQTLENNFYNVELKYGEGDELGLGSGCGLQAVQTLEQQDVALE